MYRTLVLSKHRIQLTDAMTEVFPSMQLRNFEHIGKSILTIYSILFVMKLSDHFVMNNYR